jgi:tRNA (guanine26-N2/guanine27-N2)-dimethyltransferase
LFKGFSRKAIEQDCSIKPLLSLAMRHFVKVFVEKLSSIDRANSDSRYRGHVFYCRHCFDHFMIPQGDVFGTRECIYCGSSKIDQGGPIWIGPLHDAVFCRTMLDSMPAFQYMGTKHQIAKMLGICEAESGMASIGHDIHEITKKIKVGVPAFDVILEELKARGWAASRDSFNRMGLRTPAPRSEVIDVLRTLV